MSLEPWRLGSVDRESARGLKGTSASPSLLGSKRWPGVPSWHQRRGFWGEKADMSDECRCVQDKLVTVKQETRQDQGGASPVLTAAMAELMGEGAGAGAGPGRYIKAPPGRTLWGRGGRGGGGGEGQRQPEKWPRNHPVTGCPQASGYRLTYPGEGTPGIPVEFSLSSTHLPASGAFIPAPGQQPRSQTPDRHPPPAPPRAVLRDQRSSPGRLRGAERATCPQTNESP